MPISKISDSYKVQWSMMETGGIWPKENPTVFYRLKMLISYISLISLCTTMWMHFIKVITDFTLISEILYIMITITATIIKLVNFKYQEKKFLKLLNIFNSPIFKSYPEDLDYHMAKTIKYSTYIAKVYRFLVFCCVFLIGIFPLLDDKLLPFPFDFDIKGHIIPMYTFQLSTEFVAAWENSTMDTLCTSMMGVAGAQLDILAEKIIRIKNSPQQGEKVTNQLNECVEHHLAIIESVELIEAVFGLGLLAQFLTSIVVLCNTLFCFVLVSQLSFQFFMLANYLVIVMIQLFIYCWYGNAIMTKSLEIGEACYFSDWYNNGPSFEKHIFLTMERSKRPLCVRAMKFSTLSLSTFTGILQWSYSCLALLLKVYYRKYA